MVDIFISSWCNDFSSLGANIKNSFITVKYSVGISQNITSFMSSKCFISSANHLRIPSSVTAARPLDIFSGVLLLNSGFRLRNDWYHFFPGLLFTNGFGLLSSDIILWTVLRRSSRFNGKPHFAYAIHQSFNVVSSVLVSTESGPILRGKSGTLKCSRYCNVPRGTLKTRLAALNCHSFSNRRHSLC